MPKVQMFDDSLDFVRPYSEGMTPRPLSEKRASGWLFDAMLELGNEEARNHSVGLLCLVSADHYSVGSHEKRGCGAGARASSGSRKARLHAGLGTGSRGGFRTEDVVLEGAAALESLGVRLITLPEHEESTPEGRFLAILTVLITAFADHMQAVDAAARGKLVTGLFGDRYRCLEEGACDL